MAKTEQTASNWHKAVIVAKLHMAGTSLRKLAAENELFPTALTVALHRDWPKAEGIIAEAIGVEASEIWPVRYAKRAAKRAKQQHSIASYDANAIVGECRHDCNIKVAGGR